MLCQVLRAWLLRHRPIEVGTLEVAATQLQCVTGEHAAALDLMRWAEAVKLCDEAANGTANWRMLYFKILRHTAEERAASANRLAALGASASSAIDLGTKHISEITQSRPPASFSAFPAQLTGATLSLPLSPLLFC